MTPAPQARVDIGALLDNGPWTAYQKALTALAALAVLFDGFDIQILGFAIPSIMQEWHVARPAFSPVLALGLFGMALGAPVAGFLGDRFGRRSALIGCVIVFGAATLLTAFCQGLGQLAALRFITGMGAGGALPNASALAAEFAPLHRRPVAVTLTVVCIPLGGVLGGIAAAQVLPSFGWRMLYLVGGGSAVAVAFALFCGLPESPRFLARRRERWNQLAALLRKMGRDIQPNAAFEDASERRAESQPALKSLFGREYLRDTAGLWIAFFACLNAVYLVFSWLPSMLTAQGLDVAAASSGLAAYNFGGVLGVLMCAPVIAAAGSRLPLFACALAGAASALAIEMAGLGRGASHLLLILGFGLHGVFVNAVQTALFALAAHVYPTKVRASGVAAAAAVGRLGAILSSFTGAAIIQSGSSAYLNTLAVSMVCTFAGLAVVKRHFQPKK